MNDQPTMVIVEWLDSRQADGSWKFTDGYPISDPVRCLSVGWLVHTDDNVIVLAQSIADQDATGYPDQMAGTVTIPAVSVVSQEILGSVDNEPGQN